MFPPYTHKILCHYSDHGLNQKGYNNSLQKQDNTYTLDSGLHVEIIHSIPIKAAFPVLKVKEDCLLRISRVVNTITTCPFTCLHVSFQEETFTMQREKVKRKDIKAEEITVFEGK